MNDRFDCVCWDLYKFNEALYTLYTYWFQYKEIIRLSNVPTIG